MDAITDSLPHFPNITNPRTKNELKQQMKETKGFKDYFKGLRQMEEF